MLQPSRPEISIGYYRGPVDRVLDGLDRAGLEGAVLELSGDTPAALADWIETRGRTRPDLVEANRKARGRRVGPAILGQGGFCLAIEGDNLAAFRAMGGRYADPEIALDLAVYDTRGELVAAPDVGDNEIWVSAQLPELAVQRFKRALGAGLDPWKDR